MYQESIWHERSYIFLQLWIENVLMVLIALFFAWFFIEMFSGYANRLLESNVMYTAFDWQLSLAIFILLPLLTTIYPYLKYNYLPPVVYKYDWYFTSVSENTHPFLICAI